MVQVLVLEPQVEKVVPATLSRPSTVMQRNQLLLHTRQMVRASTYLMAPLLSMEKSMVRSHLLSIAKALVLPQHYVVQNVKVPKTSALSYDIVVKPKSVRFAKRSLVEKCVPKIGLEFLSAYCWSLFLLEEKVEEYLINVHGLDAVLAALDKVVKFLRQRSVYGLEFDALENYLLQKYVLLFQRGVYQLPKYMMKMTPLTMLVLRGKEGMMYIVAALLAAWNNTRHLFRYGELYSVQKSVVGRAKTDEVAYPSIVHAGYTESLDFGEYSYVAVHRRLLDQYRVLVRDLVLKRLRLLRAFGFSYMLGYEFISGGGGYPYFLLYRRKMEPIYEVKLAHLFRVRFGKSKVRFQENPYTTHFHRYLVKNLVQNKKKGGAIPSGFEGFYDDFRLPLSP
jgi:hypothetical protein